ncbi:hypothetical protein ACFT8W_08735 [Streptomyces hygroscopicus]|uniref:hypothetical protein n=1 Tax=Streptomyces hygroscopicus TaxID=1912 RepID=UPI00363F43F4
MTNDAPALVFIYDRDSGGDASALQSRIHECRSYARLMGWQVAGQWVERGDSENRLFWRAMAAAMAFQGIGRRTVCLVSSWGRISTDPLKCASLRQLVHEAGGVCFAVAEAGKAASSGS